MTLKVLHVASECVPFAKAGGLGDVVGALPKTLAARGHDVRVLLPKYGFVDTAAMVRHAAPLAVPLGDGEAWCALWETRIPGSPVPVYFLEHEALYAGPHLYTPGYDVRDWARFALLSRAAFQLARHLEWVPDVIHGHDWPTGVVGAIHDCIEGGAPFEATATVMSLHNVAHQPLFPPPAWKMSQLPERLFRASAFEDHGAMNPFKGAIATADLLVAVSARYAWEITTELGGAGLHELFRARRDDLIGIRNGVDTEIWNPRTDPRLPARYDVEDLSGKMVCKAALQREVGLPIDREIPLLGIICRMTHQKGVDLLLEAAGPILDLGVQLVVLGSGDPAMQRAFEWFAGAYPSQAAAVIGYSEDLAHRIEAGIDYFLMPSRFEPCGLNQMYSQIYGTPPVARRVGGLVDSIVPFPTDGATGFLFDAPTAEALYGAVRQAVELFRHAPHAYLRMQERGMAQDFSWDGAGVVYEQAYLRALARARAAAAPGLALDVSRASG